MPNDELLQRVADQVEALHYAYFGNGEPGIKIRVDRLEQLRAADVKKREGQSGWVKLVVGIVLTAVVTNTVALGFVLLRQPAKADVVQVKGR